MSPTFLLLGLVFGIAFGSRWLGLAAISVVVAITSGVITAIAEEWSLLLALGASGLVLTNLAIGAAVGVGGRLLVGSMRSSSSSAHS